MDYREQALDLLSKCRTAQKSGKDFPAIWQEIIKQHPVTAAGAPVSVTVGNNAALEVLLVNGQKLVSERGGFLLRP